MVTQANNRTVEQKTRFSISNSAKMLELVIGVAFVQ